MSKNLELKSAIFQSREDASSLLINMLPKEILKPQETVVLGVSEGGVYFANKIAKFLEARMDLLLSEPIYSHVNPKLAIAMIGETEEMVMHQALIDSFEISKDYIYSEASRKYKEKLLSYVHKYRNGKILDGLDEKYVVLVDECVETGLTMMTAIKTVISLGAKNVFIAVPILDNVVHESLLNVCDNLFCPHKIDDYISIEYYYERLDPFTFEDIDAIMDENRKKQRNN
jgi:putative phosphoribosyl transferase